MATANSRGSYAARQRVRLTQQHVAKARRLIAGDTLQGRGLDLADTESQGLVLRVTRRSGTWLLKHRSGTVRLGDIEALAVDAARTAADRARLALKEGKDPAVDARVFEAAAARGLSMEDALDAAYPVEIETQSDEDRLRDGPWHWGDLVDEFLKAKLPTLKARWAVQFERHLRRAVEGPLRHRPVASLAQRDMLAVRDRVARERTLSAAADTVEAVKACLSWGKKFNGHLTGLRGHPWWQDELEVEWASTPRDRTPTLEELGRTLAVAGRHRALGATGKETAPGMMAALWAVVLTGQRAGALTGTLRKTVRAWPERPGWEIWSWTAGEMKGGRPHAIPMPPEALAAIRRHRTDPTSPFLFPSRVPGKAVTPVGMTQFMDRLRGKEKAGKAGSKTSRPSGDLFAQHDIRLWTPHDVRRTLAAYLDMERLGGAASAILAHRPPLAKGDPGQERELAAAITLKHYIHGMRLDLKAEGMAAWVAAILAAYEIESAALTARGSVTPIW